MRLERENYRLRINSADTRQRRSRSTVGLVIVGVVLLVILLLWWHRSDPVSTEVSIENGLDQTPDTKLASAIQTISEASASSRPSPSTDDLLLSDSVANVTLSDSDNRDLQARFSAALEHQRAGNRDMAKTLYAELMRDYPSIPEPFINHAHLLSLEGDLQAAKSSLEQGVQSNLKTSMLVQGLNKVHAALAAQAYRKALNPSTESQAAQLALPHVQQLRTGIDLQDRVRQLQSNLDQQRESLGASTQQQTEYQQKISDLQAQLQSLETSASTQLTTQEQEIQRLQSDLTAAREALSKAQVAEREAGARVVRAEQNAQSELATANSEMQAQLARFEDMQSQLEVSQSEIQQLKSSLSALETELESTQSRLAQAQMIPSSSVASTTQANTLSDQHASDPVNSDAINSDVINRGRAIALVKSWAQAWSDQNVPAYVSHYTDDYSSSASLSRDEWLVQRQVRLSNKAFIDVRVSEFVVEDRGEQFAVTFQQHYRSNVIDDTVRKELLFAKRGDDVSRAKIVRERLISN